MDLPTNWTKELAGFPAVLRELVEAELAAGNEVAEVGHGYPAAPCGAYIKLARAVGTRPRTSEAELAFYDRNTPTFSGEFTDAKRHFFVLEPPHPPTPPPDMDAIRAELEKAGSGGHVSASSIGGTDQASTRATRVGRERGRQLGDNPKSAVGRFKASMVIDYEKWHEGVGYDLTILSQASPEDLRAIEALLVEQGVRDWRDVEALSAIDSETARALLKRASRDSDTQVRMAVHRYAPEQMTEAQRIDSLVKAIETAEVYGGLTQALLEVRTFHPPEIIRALLRGLMERDGGTAVHFAAMLCFLHGKASSPFDMAQRPFFLRFNTADQGEREKVVRELCAMIGAEPSRCIKPKGRSRPAKE